MSVVNPPNCCADIEAPQEFSDAEIGVFDAFFIALTSLDVLRADPRLLNLLRFRLGATIVDLASLRLLDKIEAANP